MTFRRHLLGASAALAAALAGSFATSAPAHAYPDKPVTLLVPFPPGGSTDAIARALAPKLQERLGGTFIVDNKAGATGTIGASQVKRAAPDGSTLLVSSLGPLVIAPHLIKGVPYDATKDFDLLTVAVQAPNVLVVPRALAITGAQRSSLLPNVPTLSESGVKGVDVYSWQAVAAPKGLPADVKAKLHGALVAALNDPALKTKLVEQGFEIVANTPEQFTKFQAAEYARWKQVIETRKITAD